jgi:poly(A) polymerase
MQPSSTIEPQEWMTSPQTRDVMSILGGFEDEPKAMFVGGCVRNAIIGKPVNDIDIATIHRPDAVMQMLLGAGIRAVPTGMEHGTVTAIIDKTTFEITTLRRDVETDGRHAVIAFTDRWDEDAERRDFTINTLLATPDGRVFDPTGQGLDDLARRKIIFVGEAGQRIAEDYLRILRFFRFHGQYGEGAPDATAMEACRMHAEKMAKLSKERITQELFKILSLPNAADILDQMYKADVLSSIRSGSYDHGAMEVLCKLQNRYEVVNALARLNLLIGFHRSYADQWMVLSNEQKDRLDAIAEAYKGIKPVNKKHIRALVYQFDNGTVLQSYLLWLAVTGNNPDLEIMDIARYWQPPSFPITGDDLIAAGIPPGKNLGAKLKALEEKWIKSDFKTLPKI